MRISILPSTLGGVVQAPASKSSMQRACAAALLANGITYIHNAGHSNDDKAALDIIRRLGAITENVSSSGDEQWKITSNGVRPVDDHIDCGESGLSIRMFTPLVALSDRAIRIDGSGSLTTRPMDFFDKILPQLGVDIKTNDGRLPLHLRGPLRPANIEVDGSLSSQFLTGLLLAYSAANASDVSIRVNGLRSKPYIDLTLDVMRAFGMHTPQNHDYHTFYFGKPNHITRHTPHEYTVEGDWSGAAFLLVAGAIAGPITVRGLDVNSSQADKKILDALMACNAAIAIDAKEIKMHRANMAAFEFDATDCPDLFPPLVALAAYCEGKTIITGATRLTHKESDRAQTLRGEFRKMGVDIQLDGDRMIIIGSRPNGAELHSQHDHRIAMACAIAALGAHGESSIDEAQAIDKSYPDFYRDLNLLQASLTLPGRLYNSSNHPF